MAVPPWNTQSKWPRHSAIPCGAFSHAKPRPTITDYTPVTGVCRFFRVRPVPLCVQAMLTVPSRAQNGTVSFVPKGERRHAAATTTAMEERDSQARRPPKPLRCSTRALPKPAAHSVQACAGLLLGRDCSLLRCLKESDHLVGKDTMALLQVHHMARLRNDDVPL